MQATLFDIQEALTDEADFCHHQFLDRIHPSQNNWIPNEACNDCEEYILRATGLDARDWGYAAGYKETWDGGVYGTPPWPTYAHILHLRWSQAAWRLAFDFDVTNGNRRFYTEAQERNERSRRTA